MPSMPPTFRPAGQADRGKAWTRRAKAEPVERIRGRRGVELRKAVLDQEPFCRACAEVDRVAESVEVDHIVPLARGGTNARSNLQGLCEDCHAAKSARERQGQWLPAWLPAPAIPVTVVCGPPAAGKSTYVATHAAPGDLVIDLDEIVQDLTGTHGHQLEAAPIDRALWERNRRLAALERAASGRAWFIVSAATQRERDFWASKLAARVVLLNPGERECIRRASGRTGRDHVAGVRAWFHRARAE